MNETTLNNLKSAYNEYLSKLSIGCLRSVGRNCGVAQSTLKKKAELIGDIIAVLTGELAPIEKSNRGAPVKDGYVDPVIFGKLQEIKMTYLTNLPESAPGKAAESAPVRPNVLELRASDIPEETSAYYEQEVYVGQLETINGVSCLLPLNGRENSAEQIIVSASTIKACKLREGDVVSCRAEPHHATLVATEILTVNELPVDTPRELFEECEVCYPQERLSLYAGENSPQSMKYIDWLIPFGKGQRCLISAPPKTGKTQLLQDFARALSVSHPEMRLLILLIDQSPEAVGEFKKAAPNAELVYTTFDDDADRHVFMADFLLKRAKRFVEAGMDVVLLVDSVCALTRAYNDSLGEEEKGIRFSCGLKSKALSYIRKYFGSARCLAEGGSLAIVGTVSFETGNPIDDLVSCDLLGICNAEIHLDKDMAAKRIFPAIDAETSQTRRSDLLFTEKEAKMEAAIRRYLSQNGNEVLAERISRTDDPAAFLSTGSKKQRASATE